MSFIPTRREIKATPTSFAVGQSDTTAVMSLAGLSEYKRWTERCLARISPSTDDVSRRVVKLGSPLSHLSAKPIKSYNVKNEWYQAWQHLILTMFVNGVVEFTYDEFARGPHRHRNSIQEQTLKSPKNRRLRFETIASKVGVTLNKGPRTEAHESDLALAHLISASKSNSFPKTHRVIKVSVHSDHSILGSILNGQLYANFTILRCGSR
jgi:hypothetical protein